MAILSAEIFVECFQSFSTKFLFQAHRCDKIFGNPPEFSSVAVFLPCGYLQKCVSPL